MPTKTVPTESPAMRSWERDRRLRALGYEDYSDYLRSPQWGAVKRRYRESLLPQECGLCRSDGPLEFHHKTYERVGEEELRDIVPLCHGCHSMVHDLERRGMIEGLDPSSFVDPDRAAKNRAEAAKRLRAMKVERENTLHHVERDLRQHTTRLREVFIIAHREDIDLRDEAKTIEQALASAEEKVGRVPPETPRPWHRYY